MSTIRVELGGRGYDVLIEEGALAGAAAHLGRFATRGRLIVVTDDHLAATHLETLRAALEASDIECPAVVLAPGESAKSWSGLEELTDRLLDLGVERGEYIVALGGGVIGDLVGFAAAILKRGCGFVQLPTTLLAQVDSSVGGKTAINSRAGKNLIGAFHQPAFVLIDPTVLDTLPPRELCAGYAEIVKYGLIDDAEFFAWCEENGSKLLAGDRHAQALAIETSIAAKARIVGEDELETTGRRALLNLGHTFGHALEAETGFSDALLHGEAVAAGMALAFRYSARRRLCTEDDAFRIAAHLDAVGLPSGLEGIEASGERLVEHMMHDKKMAGGTLPFLLARGIGETFIARDVDLGDVAEFLDSEDR